MLFLMETGILKISNSLFWSTMYWLPVNHLVPCWLFTKLCQMFPGILCCSMSPLWVEQNDPARVNMSSTVFPPPDIDWAHTHTHTFSTETSTEPERRDRLQLSEPAVVRSELGLFSPWIPRSPLASSLHGSPDLAAKQSTTVLYGLPWSGDPFHLQG